MQIPLLGIRVEKTPRALSAALMAGIIAAFGVAQAWNWIPSEPFFNNDETRHVMTGVFFRDFFRDLPLTHPREYAIE